MSLHIQVLHFTGNFKHSFDDMLKKVGSTNMYAVTLWQNEPVEPTPTEN